MKKLKTVRDLERYCHRYTARRNSGDMIKVLDYNELRTEAIEGVKAGMSLWEFANITEEDLK